MVSGSRLGHYEILEPLGAGGMGEVYRARDSTLDRSVAIKVLPDDFAADAERLARFAREAKLLAQLNHPNIATIYGLEDVDGVRFIAMECIEGETLAEQLATSGRLDVDEALAIARQIAEALEAAHESGIIHRDLKPANVKVTPDYKVKVLDFGLAKASGAETAPARGGADSSGSPTMPAETRSGVILGTPPYMSPEQARGKPLDKRTDIWSYGCLLYELLVGRRPFSGETVSDTIGAILHTEPDWRQLPAATPPAARRLLRRCLAKDPRQRLHDIADARIELEDEGEEAPLAAAGSTLGYRIAVAVLAVALIVSATAALRPFSQPADDRVETEGDNPLAGARFSKLTDFSGSQYDATISPDGRFVAFVSNHDGPFEILVGQVGTGDFRRLAADRPLFASDDARSPVRAVGFNGDGSEIWLGGGPWQRVRMVPLLGGPVRNFLGENSVHVAWSSDGEQVVYHERLAGDPVFVADPNGANSRLIQGSAAGNHQHFQTWSLDGQWIYLVRGRMTTWEMDLWRMRADGTGLEQLTRGKLDVRYPTPIDERTLLYSARDADGAGPWLWAVDVETGLSRRASVGLEQYSSVSASADGRRLVATVQDPGAGLWRVPILDRIVTERDAEAFADLGTTRALAPRFGGGSMFYLSSRGSGDGLWRYREGEVAEIWRGSSTALLEPAAVSPDGDAVALLLRRDDGWHLSILSADGASLNELSKAVDARGAAAWSPDGQWIITGGSAAGVMGLFKIPVDGGAPQRIVDGEAMNPVWSPDGSLIIYAGPQVNVNTRLLAVRPDGEPVELPEIEVFRSGERMRFLPDGSGLVYMKGKGASQDFWLLDLTTMKSRQLTQLDPTATMRTFDITADGQRIVFDRLSLDSDVVLIERQPADDGPR